MTTRPRSSVLRRRLSRIQALVTDVDGVMTDGGMYYGVKGEVLKKFHTRDGMGIARLHAAGIRVAFITGEETDIVRRRAEKLKVSDVYTGIDDKRRALDKFLKTHHLEPRQVAYIGDDVNDLPAMERAGVAIAVKNATLEVRREADWITTLSGGRGAVREVCEMILLCR